MTPVIVLNNDGLSQTLDYDDENNGFNRLGCFFGIIGIVSCKGSENVRYPNVVLPGVMIEPTAVRSEIYRPPGNRPFPAIIVLPGCGGPDAHHKLWAETLVSQGYIAVVIDSFSPHGFGNICKKTTVVTPEMRVSDIYGSAEYLHKLSYVAKAELACSAFRTVLVKIELPHVSTPRRAGIWNIMQKLTNYDKS